MYIYKAAVVGGGTMGAGIAQVITYSGLPVVVKEVSPQLVEKTLAVIRGIYQGRVDKGKMSLQELEAKMALVTGTTSDDELKDADVVIEAVPERLELKKQVFAELDGVCQPSAMLASNTSSLPISALAAATKRPEKVVGIHFFFPAHVMKLIEIIPGLLTSQETVDDATAFAEGLRKLPVRVNECPGFLVNRLLMPYLNEAVYCLQEGIPAAQIEQAMTGLGWPMGPFTLVDALGLDVCAEVGRIMLEGYGPRMQPAELWELLINAKRLGRKTGAGFYRYGDATPPPVLDPKDRPRDAAAGGKTGGGAKAADAPSEDEALRGMIAQAQAKAGRKGAAFAPERLMYAMVNEAALALQEGISSPAEIDLAVVAGLGYPLDHGGILHYADEVGVDTVLAGLDRLTRELGPRFHPAHRLRRMAAAGLTGTKTKRGFFDYA